ncbi:MAG: aconitate hydratase [Gammaproteobacteria bacterium]|nr:MAG: aconitate hydratase AcnA [Pseudomonadota bacterium]MBC6943906.1 aconitate hydratase AcnA [Gammaproteobacteria bacterium]MCE7895290.1 aconitate hydratase AcnA [Gammaproteobacteria bacterium PRO8]MDL1880224.1 aconitate hydratase AcnA [Gammaproteobacteria bacterium PRO2]MCL4776154.1 aconitate hydratase AcnA [Gammaproteobacteria bacterium]
MAHAIDPKSVLNVDGKEYEIHRLDAITEGHVARLPFSLKILLENLLRHRGAGDVRESDISALANWDPRAEPNHEIAFTPARVILQDFTGVPAVVDLAAMREAVVKLGGRPETINPLSPAELVIDHSVQVDHYGSRDSLAQNIAVEFQRNLERYSFLRWGQKAFRNFKVVPPNTGIVHQVNIEHLARVVFDVTRDGRHLAYPDTLVGTDSHTTMANGLGVLGWGVGGIEAEAAMLGQPVTMLIPQVLGVKLTGSLREGTTATDLVLTLTEHLRKKGVVNKFVEFFGDGLGSLPLADRATLANMSPEFGSTCAIFPIDRETIRYLTLTGRDAHHVALVEAYARAQGLWREDGQPAALYSDVLELDLGSIEPTLAGPRRPQDRLPLATVASAYRKQVVDIAGKREGSGKASVTRNGKSFEVADGAVLIAAITSCTNTSNPSVMIAAGLLARNARKRGLAARPWVKTSLAPGSRVVTNYLEKAGLLPDLEALGFDVVGYGCTTCIGNSGPLDDDIAAAVKTSQTVGCAVLSGNRNFEGRIHPQVRMNYLASPPLVVAYALAGSMNVDLTRDPIGNGADGKPVFLKDIWPSQQEIAATVGGNVDSRMFQSSYVGVFAGDANWQKVPTPTGDLYAWDAGSTYVQHPPYFTDMPRKPRPVADIRGARALAVLGDSVTTDHISPAGSIAVDSPAGRYLVEHGVKPRDFNSYGARRGNHEVMMRGTFANIRLRNLLVPGVEGGVTLHLPDNRQMSIFDASMRYQEDGVPLVILAGKEYGSGSSRDWAAKGTMLLGVKAVIAESYERIHRSNLIGMGILPLQFTNGENAQTLGLSGRERFDVEGLDGGAAQAVTVIATGDDGKTTRFRAQVRIDTPKERAYYAHGGILHYVLRQIVDTPPAA